MYRDGVINQVNAYVHQIANFHFIDGTFEIVAAAKSAGYLVVVITNQARIGRGFYTETEFHNLMNWVKEQFEQHNGAIDAVYFCPDHPVHGLGSYKKVTELRKPGPGMILAAAKDHGIDLSLSIMIGDKETDEQAAVAAGVGKFLHFGLSRKFGASSQINKLSEAIADIKPKTK